MRFDTLQTIDFRYNLQINSDVASIISQVSNPNSLNKLLLDGCQRFDDYALALLTEKFCVTFDLKSSDLKGGARGLKFLSLNECRNISDKSMTYISKLKKLETLQMRGCHITDNGTLLLISKHNSYQSLDFSGTEVSNASFLIENCPKLKYLCINTVPDFPKNLHKNISVEFIDENFEYDLIPVDISYPSRTLKSRANLTIQRLIYNIQSSLNLRHQLIIIFCNTHEIANYYTLKEVQKYHGTNDRLILQYDIKSNNSKVNKSL